MCSSGRPVEQTELGQVSATPGQSAKPSHCDSVLRLTAGGTGVPTSVDGVPMKSQMGVERGVEVRLWWHEILCAVN